MDVVYDRCAGIDISKADVKVCFEVIGPNTPVWSRSTARSAMAWPPGEHHCQVGGDPAGSCPSRAAEAV
ncbi:hypothetical protein QFZ24_010052 [Streptomyces phaeochromogenes]|uniref:hypothetical protein n=1 Tax=Streptomyces phaeochromogenes TaxID=1923 RepID=UPI00278E58A0|nr:hypothetical protein [Streptomyces phaeochromogenes]